jgi:hydroxymethylglutaryl-CoA reductase (NADPH)
MRPRIQIVSFLTLHILNLCTTLTPAAAAARHNTLEDRAPDHARAVDLFSPGVQSVLEQVQAALGAAPDALLAKVHPPVHLHAAVPPPPARPSPGLDVATSGAALDRFLESWTHLVGDPVMSKWIVCLLALSVGLNGLLLRGLGLSAGVSAPGPRGAVRFEPRVDARSPLRQAFGASEAGAEAEPKTEEKQPTPEKLPTPKAQPPVIVVPPPSMAIAPSTSLLDAIDAKLLQAQEAENRMRAAELAPAPDAPVRPLATLVEIFEATKPASVALAGMNDEEVVALAQAGKIAPYALEKVLGDLERAVKVRRALICKFCDAISECTKLIVLQPAHRPRRHWSTRLSR